MASALRASVWCVLVVAGCVTSASVPCGDRVCPQGTICKSELGLCVTNAQLEACAGVADGEGCPMGECRGGVCIALDCGDGIAVGLEICDGADLRANDCYSAGGYYGGTLACANDCRFDFSGCVDSGRCNDGIKNGPESCDQSDLGGVDCTALGYYDAPGLACSGGCTFDTRSCTGSCGDSVTNGSEVCDGVPPSGKTCASYGFGRGIGACSAFCGPGFETCSGVGWQPVETGSIEHMRAVWGSAADDVFAVGETGAIVHFDGTAWTTMPSGTSIALNGVWGSAHGDVFAVGDGGLIVHFDGTSWTTVRAYMSTALPLNAVWGSGPSNVFAVGGKGLQKIILRYNGTSWTTMTATSEDLKAIWGSASNDVWAVGADGTILHFNGASWSGGASTVNSTLYGVWGSGPADIYAAGDNAIFHSTGGSWTQVATSAGGRLRALFGLGPSDIWAAGDDGTFTHWDGVRWSGSSSGANAPLAGIWGTSAGNMYAAGDGGVLHFDGTAWEKWQPREMLGLWGAAVDDIWSAGNNPLHFDGTTWTDLGSAAPAGCWPSLGVWGLSSNNVYMVGMNSHIARWTGSWTNLNWGGDPCATAVGTVGTSSQYNLESAWGSGPSDVYVVGTAVRSTPTTAVVAHSSDGTTFTEITSTVGAAVAGTTGLHAAWGTAANDVYFVGDAGAIVHWNGAAWSAFAPITSRPLFAIWGSSAANIYAVGGGGTILHYDGVAWSAEYSGTSQALKSVVGTSAGDVFVGGGQSILHRLGTGAWEQIDPPMALDTHAVWGVPGQLFFGGSSGVARLDRATVTCSGSETDCTNGWDDDCDGASDGADPSCAGASYREQCANLVDDDYDGIVDCADSDCTGFPTCAHGGLCQPASALACGASVTATTEGGLARLDAYGCSAKSAAGPERFFRSSFSPGTVTLTLVPTDPSKDLDLVVLGTTATGACAPSTQCLAASSTTAATETVTFTAVAGATYYIGVDGADAAGAAFTVSSSCTP